MTIEMEKSGTVFEYEYNQHGALIGWRHRGTEVGCFWSEWEYFGDENTIPADEEWLDEEEDF